MTDTRQFGSRKGTSAGAGGVGESQHCAECEAMLTDAVDGTLSGEEQTRFDAHMAGCEACSSMLADARRGAAWLEMLRDPRPEPPAALLERILAETSGAHPLGVQAAMQLAHGPVAVAPGFGVVGSYAVAKVLPFRRRVAQVLLQPRLAMTAAMAFFSMALTLNLMGVRLEDLRVSDLRPSSIRRGFYEANASVARYYEGLRVVYELESRVRDMERSSDTDSNGGAAAPAAGSPDSAAPDDLAPGGQAPGGQPDETPQSPKQPAPAKPSPGPGSSRRESRDGALLQVVAAPAHAAREGGRA